MKSTIVFIKKELIEALRSYKIMVILPIFFFFGVISPIVAKIMPELFKTIEGVVIELPEAKLVDAWIQFYENMTIQIFMFVIVFANTISNEVRKGTLTNLVVKGLPRKNIILAKFLFIVFIWTICFMCSVFSTNIISRSLLVGEVSHLFLIMFSTWVFGILLISIMIFGSVLFKNLYGSILIVFLFYVFSSMLSVVPVIKIYHPYAIMVYSCNVLNATMEPMALLPAFSISIIFIFTFLGMSIKCFNKITL